MKAPRFILADALPEWRMAPVLERSKILTASDGTSSSGRVGYIAAAEDGRCPVARRGVLRL